MSQCADAGEFSNDVLEPSLANNALQYFHSQGVIASCRFVPKSFFFELKSHIYRRVCRHKFGELVMKQVMMVVVLMSLASSVSAEPKSTVVHLPGFEAIKAGR